MLKQLKTSITSTLANFLHRSSNHTAKPKVVSNVPTDHLDDDDATVVTSNTTAGSDTSSWTTVPGDACTALLTAPVVPRHRSAHLTHNYYHALDFDASSIAVDSGASDGFGDEDTPGTNRRHTDYGITMASATGDCKTSIATDTFDLPLPRPCLDYHVFKRGDVQRPLLSVGKACDAGCDVTFNSTHCNFTKDGHLLLRGYRDRHTGLYLLPRTARTTDDLPPPPIDRPVTRTSVDDLNVRSHDRHTGHGFNLHQPLGLGLSRQMPCRALSAYQQRTIPQLIRYLHACAGFPTTDTWIQAINQGYFLGWPGLDASRVYKHLPKSEETALGHLKLNRQGTRSTSKGENESPEDDKDGSNTSKGASPEQTPNTDVPEERKTSETTGRKRNVVVSSFPLKDLKGIVGTDQTGRFPTISDRGHKYIFMMCDVDTDLIYAVPIKSRKTGELIRAFKEAYETLVSCGFEPILHRTDHETSTDLIAAIKAKGLDYELMPPSNHRSNPAERAIQTFKSHFISTLNGLDRDYPASAWDLLLPQVNMTLNMLRTCGVNPAHSAYSYIHGAYDFSAHPLAPLGCRAVVHERSIANGGKRGSWGNRGKVGYYIGPAMNSYRVWRFYIPETKGIVESCTASFFPQIPMPTISIADQIAESLDSIEKALKQQRPTHTDVTEDTKLASVIGRLRGMYTRGTGTVTATDTPKNTRATEVPPPEDTPTRTESDVLPRVPYHESINRYRPKKKQRFPIGTRVRVREQRKTFIGKATEYDPYTGLYYIEFEDGEFEEFDDDEMTHFRLVKTYTPRRPTTSANQITVQGYFPKAGPKRSPLFSGLGAQLLSGLGAQGGHLYGLNAGSIWDEELHKWMAYRELIRHPNPKIRKRWEQAGNNEFARLAQGHEGIEGLDVVTFILKKDMPDGKQATYARYVVDYRPEKDEPWRLRITCGGDKLEYTGDTTTHSASMETIKCQLNSIISTHGAKCATGDISNMYLGSDLPEAEYVRFRLNLIPKEFAAAYNLSELATPDGYVYARVNKAWYGLKQAGKIAHDDLVERLAEAGYQKTGLVEGYFKHETRNIDFTLVVDDFLIKYVNDDDLQHLREAVGKYYKFKVDLEAKQYVGINLKWNYKDGTVRLSMDGYVEQALRELEYADPGRPCYAPSRYTFPKYGAMVQYVTIDESAPLGLKQIRYIQRAVGKLLYYARAVDPTMLHAINDISLSASKGTAATLDATMYLLNYAHTNPNTEIVYRRSGMILHVDSDAAYLVAPEARSRAGGYQYLSNKEGTLFNGPVLVLAKVIKNVMASATEAELGALYMNAQEAVGLRNCLESMGFPQPPTPLKTDNSTANGIINNTMKQKRSKAIDVRFYWLRDRAKQGQFHIFWDSGKHNLADYFTKHHSPAHHKLMRPIHTYIESLSPESLQGCIKRMIGGQAKKRSGVKTPNTNGERTSI